MTIARAAGLIGKCLAPPVVPVRGLIAGRERLRRARRGRRAGHLEDGRPGAPVDSPDSAGGGVAEPVAQRLHGLYLAEDARQPGARHGGPVRRLEQDALLARRADGYRDDPVRMRRHPLTVAENRRTES